MLAPYLHVNCFGGKVDNEQSRKANRVRHRAKGERRWEKVKTANERETWTSRVELWQKWWIWLQKKWKSIEFNDGDFDTKGTKGPFSFFLFKHTHTWFPVVQIVAVTDAFKVRPECRIRKSRPKKISRNRKWKEGERMRNRKIDQCACFVRSTRFELIKKGWHWQWQWDAFVVLRKIEMCERRK